MALAGGAAAVTAWLREIGIEGMRVDRTTAEIGAEIQAIMEAAGSHGDPNNPAVPAFDADPRDHATPNDMLRLLVLLAEGNILKPDTRDFLLSAMGRTVTGPERIKGLLPPGTPVAHKTGTAGGIANDVGYRHAARRPPLRRRDLHQRQHHAASRPRPRRRRNGTGPLRFLRASVERPPPAANAVVSTRSPSISPIAVLQ